MLKGACSIIVVVLAPKSILLRYDKIRDKDQEVKKKGEGWEKDREVRQKKGKGEAENKQSETS